MIGCSGTGSPVIEQLARLGVGELVMVDHDKLEARNINRILSATMEDVRAERLKVDVLADAVRRMETGTRVASLSLNLWTPEAVKAVAQCDLVFGCMDTIDGRFLLNTVAAYYQLPYIDLGVRIAAVPDGPEKGKILAVGGGVHYLKPGGSSLISRGLFSMGSVRAAGLARLHLYRDEANHAYDHTEVNLGDMETTPASKPEPRPIFKSDVGKGDARPLLGLPELSEGGR